MERDNYFLLLEMDFEKSNYSNQEIQNTIKSKQEQWSMMTNHPSNGDKYKQNVASIPDITKIMLDPEARKLEALAAHKIMYEPLNKMIASLSAKGFLYDTEIEQISKKIKIDIDKVKKAVKKISIPIKEAEKASAPTEKLEPAITSKIKKSLELVRKKDLYDFLSLTSSDSPETLKKTAEMLASDYRKRAKDAFNTVSSELASQCVTVLGDAKNKRLYDEYLKLSSLNDIRDLIDIASSAGEIERKQAMVFLDGIKQKGFSDSEAIAYIRKYAKEKGYIIDLPVEKEREKETKKFISCGFCGQLIDSTSTATNCINCGMSIKTQCPKCKTLNSSSNNACEKCGFNFKNMSLAKNECDQARVLLTKMEFEAAENLIRQALNHWPNFSPAEELNKELATQKQLFSQSLSKIREYIVKKQFFAAQNELRQLKIKRPSFSNMEYESTINQNINSVNEFINKAKSTNLEMDIINYCLKALDICTDCIEAKNILLKYPTMPPTNLSVNTTDNGFLLRFSPSKSEGNVVYCIKRKENSIPLNINDGEKVIETSGTYFEDENISAGVSYFYSIFAIRGNIPSEPLSTKTPLIGYFPPTEFSVLNGNNIITLSWKNQIKSTGIELWKKENAIPSAKGDGQLVTKGLIESFTDDDVTNDKKYGYLIVSEYQGPNGKMYSANRTIIATPSQPPEPIRNILLNKIADRSYSISFTPTPKGEVSFYYSSTPYTGEFGDIKPKAEFDKLFSLLPLTEKSTSLIKFDCHIDGVMYVYPIVILNDNGIIGDSVKVASAKDFENLKYQLNGNKLYLEFTWPQNAKNAAIVLRTDKYSDDPNDSIAIKANISQIKYSAQAAAIVTDLERKNYFVTVFAVYGDKNNPVYSAGQNIMVINQEVKMISYTIKADKSLFGKVKGVKISLTTESKLSHSPNMIVVKKNGSTPLNKNDGDIIGTISDAFVASPSKTLSFPLSESNTKVCVKLFFENDDMYKFYRLMPPVVDSI